MNRSIMFVAVLAAATTLAACHSNKVEPTQVISADETVIPGEALMMEDSVEVTAVVTDIDHSERELTVRNIDDEISTVHVPEEVENFKEIKKGDSVVMDVYEAVAFSLDDGMGIDGNKDIAKDVVNVHTKAMPGEKPSMTDMQVTNAVATINHIDPVNRKVKLMTDSGDVMNVTVSDDVERFNELKVGQQIDVTYVQSFALSVQKL